MAQMMMILSRCFTAIISIILPQLKMVLLLLNSKKQLASSTTNNLQTFVRNIILIYIRQYHSFVKYHSRDYWLHCCIRLIQSFKKVIIIIQMEQRPNNERTAAADKPLRSSTTNKYTYKGSSEHLKLENFYRDKNNELMIKTQHGFGRQLTSKQMQEYNKINTKTKDKKADQTWRKNILEKVFPGFDETFKNQETNNLNKGGRKAVSKQYLNEYQMKQVDNSKLSESQKSQSPNLIKKSPNQRQSLEAEIQRNLDEKFSIFQQKLKRQQQARKKDKLENDQQIRLVKRQLEKKIIEISSQNLKEPSQLVQLIINLKKECQQQFKEIKIKLTQALLENNASSTSYKDAKTLKMQREQVKNQSSQEQKEMMINMKRELDRIKLQLMIKQQSQRKFNQKYQKLLEQNALIIAKQKSTQEQYSVIERKYQQSIKAIEKLNSDKQSSNSILFFSPTIFQKQLSNFLKKNIERVTNQTLSSTKLLYQLDQFNLNVSNYLTRPPFPVLLLFTSEANHTFALFSQGIQSHTSRKMKTELNSLKQFKTILLNCQTQMVIEKDPKSLIECGANFMENQLIIGSNQLVIKNNNLTTLRFYGNSFFGDKYFNIRKRSNLTCEEQDVIGLKTLEIYELFLI